MIEDIDEMKVRKFREKYSNDPGFPRWLRLPWTRDYMDITEKWSVVIFNLKKENRELKQQIRELKEEVEEKEIEPEDIEEVVSEDIYEPIEEQEINLDFMEPKIEPVEISEFTCEECDKKFPNKGLLTAHMKTKHKEESDETKSP